MAMLASVWNRRAPPSPRRLPTSLRPSLTPVSPLRPALCVQSSMGNGKDVELGASVPPGGFGVDMETMSTFTADTVAQQLKGLGGLAGVADALKTNLKTGLPTDSAAGSATVAARKVAFGENVLPTPDGATLLDLIWEQLKDETLRLLMFCATLSIAVGVAVEEARAPGSQTLTLTTLQHNLQTLKTL